MNIAEIRQKYPQYNDLSDIELAQGLHKKFYSDMDFNDFTQKIGVRTSELTPLTEEQKAKPKATSKKAPFSLATLEDC